ncbi:hypothetical protein KSP40_PGU003485 [Platanthera guangdongensis]|uniref:ATP-dependent Clp protease proteolytic subunit n=1 Tax=Platanthera guangdongensis TaxID=2320717 RepID=A0ABR2ME40_9ASPA
MIFLLQDDLLAFLILFCLIDLPENSFLVKSFMILSSKVYLSYIRSYGTPSSLTLDWLSKIPRKNIPILTSDISLINERIFKERTKKNLSHDGIWCEEDGCVFRTVFCPFCMACETCFGVQVLATDASNANLLNKPMIYGRGPMPAGMRMVPMVLPDGRLGYVLLKLFLQISISHACRYDWAECRLIRRIDVNVKNLYWADSGDLLAIATDSSFYILKYNLTPSMAIYDTMQSLKSPVGTNCVGYAYNLAGFLLAAGEKGNRVAMPLCRIALQSPAGAARGQADDVHNEANELLRIRDYLFGYKADLGSRMSTGDGKLQEMEIQCAEVMVPSPANTDSDEDTTLLTDFDAEMFELIQFMDTDIDLDELVAQITPVGNRIGVGFSFGEAIRWLDFRPGIHRM